MSIDAAELRVLNGMVNETVVETLEGLLEEAKQGRVKEVLGIVRLKGSTYRLFGGGTLNRHEVCGQLMELAWERIRQDGPDVQSNPDA